MWKEVLRWSSVLAEDVQSASMPPRKSATLTGAIGIASGAMNAAAGHSSVVPAGYAWSDRLFLRITNMGVLTNLGTRLPPQNVAVIAPPKIAPEAAALEVAARHYCRAIGVDPDAQMAIPAIPMWAFYAERLLDHQRMKQALNFQLNRTFYGG